MMTEDYLDRLDRERRLLDRITTATEQTAANTAPKLERSRMSIAQKSAFIAANGMQKYLELPWSTR